MGCPICASAVQPAVGPSPEIWVHQCANQCGCWIPASLFWRWMREHDRDMPEAFERVASRSTAPVEGRPSCPECGTSLVNASLGRGLACRGDYCAACGGLWLERAQWERLAGKKDFRDEIAAIYATVWRRLNERRRPKYSRHSTAKTGFNKISQRKPFFSISAKLQEYLVEYGRVSDIPPIYDQLQEFESAVPCSDIEGNDTLWDTVCYPADRQKPLNLQLSQIYSLLKTGDPTKIVHVLIDRIDYCEFGNSKPFRIRVVNQFNDNHDHFYVKIPDASRIYGLELEHTLSPNQVNYLVHERTLIEEHIAGIPGDAFIRDQLNSRRINRVRVAKEFVKFNERCFARLLGDMRSYNYVVDITPDFEEVQYRVRPIDFDQQSYEGNCRMYLPQFFKENAAVVKLCTDLLNYPTMKQYQMEERTLIRRHVLAAHQRLQELFRCMRADQISTPEKIVELGAGLNDYHGVSGFEKHQTMGDLVWANLEYVTSTAR